METSQLGRLENWAYPLASGNEAHLQYPWTQKQYGVMAITLIVHVLLMPIAHIL